ncbi:hypothetical protein BFJ66_g9990 [Fusarium oxysporum f. sp. cepae]|uniref:Extracellular membrane protein CFEM domain-containing protein n=1 Tax=Fusarium oxysporum f. sp. cepae TaxID=396571 RepID=A0A3L6NVC3_FUSOX|nr:hypothetical protein BFJ65_g5613 [Fusarium oxysporum f. sp. cepae]RKK35228.1 hypothetical protein BFJ67_g13392 [Fusarium oxysporum f. sp. cepae]RKK43539.1 hypothetical protein BFJ66_g9990 [Fusarium oxysporum f. sp. cepae]
MLLYMQLFAVVAAFMSTLTETFAMSLRPSSCVGNITSFPSCDSLGGILKKCNLVTGKQESIDCFCTQEVLDAYVGCEGEFRQCALSDSFDSDFETEIANWQDACGPYLPKDITTASIAEPTRTLDQDTCQTIAESCYQLSKATDACSSSYTKPVDYTSCRCESSMISLASVCEIDGSSSCLGKTPITSRIWEFQNCAAVTAFTSALVSSAPITTMPGSTEAKEGPASTLVFGPSSTMATTSSSGAVPVFKNAGPFWTSFAFILPSVVLFLP